MIIIKVSTKPFIPYQETKNKMKPIPIWIILIITTIFGLSYFLHIPYFYTLLGVSIWIFVSHLITIDDDMKDGWNNPDNSKDIWKHSKAELLIKFLIVILLLLISFIFPNIKQF